MDGHIVFAYMQNRQMGRPRIHVRPGQTISSRHARPNRHVHATLTQTARSKLLVAREQGVPSDAQSESLISPLHLVSLADEVVGETLDGRGGVSGNSAFGVVADDDGLLGLGDGETSAAL